MKYVLIEFQPGDEGEWEFVKSVTGPFRDLEDVEEYHYHVRGKKLSHSDYLVACQIQDPLPEEERHALRIRRFGY